MQQRVRIGHDADMALPEYEVATAQTVEAVVVGERLAELPLLQVGIARRGHARSRQRELDEGRAVETEAGPAAPEIGHVQEALGHGDEIRLVLAARA